MFLWFLRSRARGLALAGASLVVVIAAPAGAALPLLGSLDSELRSIRQIVESIPQP